MSMILTVSYCTNNKFVKDAKKAMDKLPQLREQAEELDELIKGLGEKLAIMDLSEIQQQIAKYDKVSKRIEQCNTEAKNLAHKIEKDILVVEKIESKLSRPQ